VYPIQLSLVPGPCPAPLPSGDELTRIGARAREAFQTIEHIRIRLEQRRIQLALFIVAESSTAAVAVAHVVAQHIVSSEPSLHGWRLHSSDTT
jgi:hypothetical protein